jgi:hypothetical protein
MPVAYSRGGALVAGEVGADHGLAAGQDLPGQRLAGRQDEPANRLQPALQFGEQFIEPQLRKELRAAACIRVHRSLLCGRDAAPAYRRRPPGTAAAAAGPGKRVSPVPAGRDLWPGRRRGLPAET